MSALTEAITDLENSSYQFELASRELHRLGAIEEREETALYVAITGDTWRNYLKAGGSPTMINHELPAELDFNYQHQAEA